MMDVEQNSDRHQTKQQRTLDKTKRNETDGNYNGLQQQLRR